MKCLSCSSKGAEILFKFILKENKGYYATITVISSKRSDVKLYAIRGKIFQNGMFS